MTERISMQLRGQSAGYAALIEACKWAKAMLFAGKDLQLDIVPDTRTVKQNRVMWSCLRDLSAQVTWCGKNLTESGWKDFITGHIEGQDMIPNMHGTGFISINRGKSTSKMTIKEMITVIDLCHAFGADQNVKWSPTSLGLNEDDRN